MTQISSKLSLFIFLLALSNSRVHSKGLYESIYESIAGGRTQRAVEPKDVNCGQYRLDTNTSYRIQSPLSSLGLPVFTFYQCAWTFQGSNGCTPVIDCPKFELPESENCASAGMEVTDSITKTQIFCGKNGPANVTTGTSSLIASYQSGIGAPPSKGFSCLVSCASEQPLTLLQNAVPPPKTTDCTCGIPGAPNAANEPFSGGSNRVVGGKNAEKFKWKWQASLIPKTRKNPFCGGSLINDRYVLTAAHCVVTTGLVTFPAAGDVVFNVYNLKNFNETITIRRGIVEAIPHPFYNAISQDYDVALIRFEPALNLTIELNVTPVCLPALGSKPSFAGEIGTVTGFGTTSEGGKQAEILQEADIPIMSNEACNQKYDGKITASMMCAGYSEGQIDACQGDSGGPFVLPISGSKARYQIPGVVSWGEGCARAEKPGVYSRVTESLEWILQKSREGVWCKE